MLWGLSISLSEDLADPLVVADVAAIAEDAGWDGVFVWDHLWNRTLEPFADPFVTVAATAIATERIRVGTLVTALPRRRTQLVAQSTASLDLLSGGRMVLGLGLGVDGYGEYSAFDEPATDDRARAKLLDAAIEGLIPMLAGQPIPSGDTRIKTVAGVQQPRVPIWVAGSVGYTAGSRRVRRHRLEGLALGGAEVWSPDHVAAALEAGGFSPGEIDVALVGGNHPDPATLAEAGATWCIPEIMPGASASEAMALAGVSPD